MNNPIFRVVAVFISLLSGMALACQLSQSGTAVAQPTPPTLPLFQTYTAVPQPINNSAVTPSMTPTVPEEPAPIMTAGVNLNVRRGPGTQYPIVAALRTGETAVIIGRSPDGFWWKIACPQSYAGECWASSRAEYSTAENQQQVPLAAVPPTPLPTHTATATPTATFTATATPTATFTYTPVPTWTATASATATTTPLASPYP